MTEQPERDAEPIEGHQAAREYEYRELASDKNEIVLTHEGKRYRLIATKNGRLVLNR